MDLLSAIILGIVEGITEFLPISSTGHLILASHILGIPQDTFTRTFEVAIQSGAILAVAIIYMEKLMRDIEIWKRIITAFIPTAVLGFLLYRTIKSLFSPIIVSIMLILWGVIFIVVEKFLYDESRAKVKNVDDINYRQAFIIGLFQSLAMIPGTSRSGSTIIGGMLMGLSRKTATEFTFLLAVPTMFAATGYDLVKNMHAFASQNWLNLAVGFAVSFVFAYMSVRWLLNYVSTNSFVPFGIYRIILGLIFLLFFL